MEKRLFYILILMCLHMVSIPLHGQYVSLKSNLLYLGTSTSNMGFEFRLGRKMSLDLWGAYNAWEFKNGPPKAPCTDVDVVKYVSTAAKDDIAELILYDVAIAPPAAPS